MTIDDIDIYRAAKLLIDEHGDEATIIAIKRATEMLDAGDLDGYAVWKRVLRAVQELQGMVPKSGEAVH